MQAAFFCAVFVCTAFRTELQTGRSASPPNRSAALASWRASGRAAFFGTSLRNCWGVRSNPPPPPNPLATRLLIVVDYFSRFISVTRLTSKTSSAVIRVLDELFATHGIPSTLVSDNGPQFSAAEFAEFARQSGFYHRTSLPKFAQSNGEAERAV